MRSTIRSAKLVSWLLASVVALACGGSCSNRVASGGSLAGGAASGEAGTSSPIGGSGNSGGSLSLGGSVANDAGAAMAGEPATVGKDDACATSSRTTNALPAVLELVVDTSGSMDWPPGWMPKSPNDSKPPGASKWDITRDALAEAVAALPAGTALGASFYPNVEQSETTCLMPFQALPIGLLGAKTSNARAAWQATLADVTPIGATPTHGAYRFGLAELTASTLPGNKFILLITDGTPTCTVACECTENNQPVDAEPLLAEAAAAYQDGVRTFVIGSPGSEQTRDVLSRLALAGGTAREPCSDSGPHYCHFDMTTEPDLASGLARALDEISSSIKSCEYPIPSPPAGQELDPDRVNVLYTPPGEASQTIPRDASLNDCNEGWQYTSDAKGVVLCGDSCAQAQSQGGRVEILFGCRTVVTVPR